MVESCVIRVGTKRKGGNNPPEAKILSDNVRSGDLNAIKALQQKHSNKVSHYRCELSSCEILLMMGRKTLTPQLSTHRFTMIVFFPLKNKLYQAKLGAKSTSARCHCINALIELSIKLPLKLSN